MYGAAIEEMGSGLMHSDFEGYSGQLTAKGWPRPIVNGWPVPWVSPHNNLSMMAPTRTRRILYNKLCQVCGEKHAKGATVFMCLDADKSYLSPNGQDFHNSYAIPMDSGILHERCFKLALARCPILRRKREEKGLIALSVNIDKVKLKHVVTNTTGHKDFICSVDDVTLVEI